MRSARRCKSALPSGAIDGATLKVSVESAEIWVTLKARVCPLSSEGPALITVANVAIVCTPASSSTAGVADGSVNDGASFNASTVMVNDCVLDVFAFGAAFAPLSVSTTLNVAVPEVFGVAVYVSAPVVGSMDGPVLKVSVPVGPVDASTKVSVWPLSFGPCEIALANPLTDCAPASSVDAGGGVDDGERRCVVDRVHGDGERVHGRAVRIRRRAGAVIDEDRLERGGAGTRSAPRCKSACRPARATARR